MRVDRRLRVLVTDERGRSLRLAGLAAWLREVAPAKAHGIVSVALVSDRVVRGLNREYRAQNHATDVLSFPSGTRVAPDVTARGRFLGDIVIARGVARRQARAAGHSERAEWRTLALHGLLHLLGYDHEKDKGQMRRIEQRLRRRGGLAEGLIERTRGRAGAPSARSVRDGVGESTLEAEEQRSPLMRVGVGPRESKK
jgi:probable rRNA maturation factor